MLTTFLALLTVGCSTGPRSCDDLDPGRERDECLHDEILALPAAEAAQTTQRAQMIQDPLIMGATVSGWVADHAGQIPETEGRALCALLQGRDQGYCLRRLSSPHLQR